MIKKISRGTGNKIYSVVGWFCYIACTIISAILNVYLLSKLDQSWAWFLLTMSLALEFGKAYILIKANTYRSLAEYMKNCKFKSSKVINKEKVFYSLYVLFAVLSITASLCFSLTITDDTEQEMALSENKIVRNIDKLNRFDEEVNELKIKVDKLNKELEAAEDEKNTYDKKTNELTRIIAQKNGWDFNNATQKIWSLPEYRLSDEKINFDKSQKRLDIVSSKLKDATSALDEKELERKEFVDKHGTLDSMNEEHDFIKNQKKEMAGSSKCFILLAETFGIPDKVKMVKFFILLYVSLLVELCIWLSSPDLRLDGGLLYSFRNDLELSTKKDVDRLLKEIKDTNNRFSSKEKEEEVKIVEKTPPKVLKELDNLKEQVEMFDREREENKAIVADLHMTYKDQIDRLNNQITSLEDDKNILENKEKDLRVQVDTLSEDKKELEDDLDEAAHMNNDKVAYIKEQEDKIKSLEEEKDYYQSEYSELAENEEHSKEALKYLTDKNRELEEKISKVDSNLKYSEDDIKKAVKKTLEKSKDEIKSLKSQLENWETNYNKVFEENSNLKLTNASLENNNKNLLQKNEELLNPKKKLSEIKVGTLEDEFKEIMENN